MTEKPGSAPKLTRPGAARVFPRKRLFRLIESAMARRALWICGPPGSGKTTLASSYIETSGLPCLWYQVDEGDIGLHAFFQCFSDGASQYLSPGGKTLPQMTLESRSDIPAFARDYFRIFFSGIPRPFAVVLDNSEKASHYQMFLDVMKEAIKETPDGCTIVFLSRTGLPPAFAREFVSQNIDLIGWNDLCLTDSESAGMARSLGYRLTARDICRINNACRGWAAGLFLMLDGAMSSPSPGAAIDMPSMGRIYDYFTEEVLREAGDAETDFFEKTAFLPEMTVKMAEGISGNEKSRQLLDELSFRQFFITRCGQKEELFEYHPLFREFLLARAVEFYPARRVLELKCSAAKLLAAAGRSEEAAALFIEARDYEGLAGMILDRAESLAEGGRLGLLESWIAALPSEAAAGSPWLLYYAGICRLPIDPVEARLKFEEAYRLFRARGDAKGTFTAWSMIVDTYMYEWKDFRPLSQWVLEFESITEEFDYPSVDVEERAAAGIFSALVFCQPEDSRLPYWLDRVTGIMQESGDNSRRLSIGRNLILYYLWMGYVTKAGVVIESLSSAVKAPGLSELPLLMFMRSAVLFYFYSASHRKALDLIDEGLRTAEISGIHLMDAMFWGQGVYNSINIGDIDRAESFLGKIVGSLSRKLCYENIYYHHQASIVASYKGDVSSAREHGEMCLRLTVESGTTFMSIPALYVSALAMIEAGPPDINRQLSALKEISETTGSKLAEYTIVLLEMLLAVRARNEARVLERLGKAIGFGRAYGLKFIPFCRPDKLSSVFSMALEAGVETGYVKELIKTNNLAGYAHEGSTDEWPWPVRIYTLGRFELYTGNSRVVFDGRAQQKPLALLKALIALGARGVPQEEAADALWPDSDGDTAYRACATTLHRLRKLIGIDRAILVSEGALTLDPRLCWVDVWRFDRLLNESESGVERQKGAHLERKAIELYRGPFLAGEKLGCIVPARERLRGRFIKHVGLLASGYEASGEIDSAIELYNKGIEADELAERFYLGLISCHGRAGNRSEAVKAYRRCKSAFARVLGAPVSGAIEAAYKKLL